MQQIVARHFKRRPLYVVLSGLAAATLCIMPVAASAATAAAGQKESDEFAAAAQEFNVPKEVLLSTSYNLTRGEMNEGEMSVDGGYGPMDLRTNVAVTDGRGDPSRPIPQGKMTTHEDTLGQAAKLLNVSPDTLKNDRTQNIRGGAAVLAESAKQLNNGKLPSNMDDWYAAVAKFSGSKDVNNATDFADNVYGTVKNGMNTRTVDGQTLQSKSTGHNFRGDRGKVKRMGLRDNSAQKTTSNGTECPSNLNCRFVPAGYAANSSDPTDYGNYDHSNRPKDMGIKYIVVHDTEGSYTSAISHFQDTSAYVSANYVIRSSDGAVTQMVKNQDTAWHAGDWYMNMHSIGIEHEGTARAGSTWYTEAMYKSSADLVRYLAKKYNIPMDRQHILGHDNIPGLTDANVVANHYDPGPYWDWNHYMDLLQNKPAGTNAREQATTMSDSQGQGNTSHQPESKVVTISPKMSENEQTVRNCNASHVCTDLTGPSNFVFLHTAASEASPLITDKLIHSDLSPGTNKIDDWSAKASTGQKYVLADQNGDWTAVWQGGQKAWFYNPASQPTAVIGHGQTIKLKQGLTSASIYGGAYPEASVYPAGVNGPAQPELSYKLTAGQEYVSDGIVPTDYFYDRTIDSSAPYDHKVFKGNDKFVKIWYNHRVMFVRASDVVTRTN
ncbi:MAG TPA: peptidoglycan recognition family protein [Candidatus Saccharimonadales bacterium]|nr:peptidoglycan recognition family protein [Candidatus Saccharimonadales bacterium]